MKDFKSLNKDTVDNNELAVLKYWQDNNIFQKSIDQYDKCFVHFDGPATANGNPGLHHCVSKFLKDAICRYQTMKGQKVIRKIGWDTHGLPVELQAEKELGFNGKKDIEKYGIEAFNKKCRNVVWENEEAFTNLTNRLGQFADIKNPYVTYDNNFIETEWYILKKFFDEKLFYEGVKITPYCPRCGTALASHEVAQGYEDVNANTVIVPMKKKDEDVYFLVWTTTPWTLIANVALCVNPDEYYCRVKSGEYTFIIAEALMNKVLGDEVTVISRFLGRELENIEYEQLLPFLSVDKKGFFITCDNYVTMEDGTGIVHIAPAFGEDDNRVGKKYNLPYLNPVGEDGKYNVGPWEGMFVFQADDTIITYLKENDKLFKKIKMVHSYPHCWRCHTPLLYYSRPSYYLEVTKLKDQIVAANKTVNWYPDYVGEKRFGNWLENLNDWAISRTRYWGTPLPLWKCSCGHTEMIGSRDELVKRAVEKIDETIDLHRPYVDDVHIICPECNKVMSRTPEVIDCWFDSGSMPFSQYHYPFENKELWESQYPADFICEGVDQTRGWFYSLLVIGVFLTGKSPYKNVLVNDLLLAADGSKMHKSHGNAIEPFTLISKYGADTIRFYIPFVSPVWTPLKFDEEGLKEVHSKFINPFKNTYSFFQMYANTDNIDIDNCNIPVSEREEIDKWLLSKYNSLVKNVTESYEEYDLNKVTRAITNFVSEDLSNWYIRRNRKRFWGSELDNSKKSVYKTTHEVLVGLCQLVAPITPFLADEIYPNLTGEESVHLSKFPVVSEKLIDETLEEKMDLVRNLISLGRYVREENKIKVRQPISEVILSSKILPVIGDLTELIKEELNVKNVTFADDLSLYMNYIVKPNFKEIGKVFGPNINAFQDKLLTLTSVEVNSLESGNVIDMEINGTTYNVDKSYVDIRLDQKEGFNVGLENNNVIVLNASLTPDLILEGNAREIVSKVQNLRKTSGFEITDRITIDYEGDDALDETFKEFSDYIKNETLAVAINKGNGKEALDINGHELKITIAVVK